MTSRRARAYARATTTLDNLEALLEHLVACGRWSPERAAGLGDDVWSCGPGPDAVDLLAA